MLSNARGGLGNVLCSGELDCQIAVVQATASDTGMSVKKGADAVIKAR